MKAKDKQTGSVNAQLREIRDAIGKEIKDMDPKEVIQFLKKKKTLHPASFWNKK